VIDVVCISQDEKMVADILNKNVPSTIHNTLPGRIISNMYRAMDKTISLAKTNMPSIIGNNIIPPNR
jgi:hypothetical protein